MSKIFSVDGVLKEIVINADGSKSVRNYQVSRGKLITKLSDPKFTLIAENILLLANLLDEDTGVSETSYTNNVVGG